MADWSVIFQPLLPLWLIAALAACGAGMSVISLWQRGVRGLWRTAAFAALLLTLANPLVETRNTTPLSDIVIVVLDDSASQKIKPRTQQLMAAEQHLKKIFGSTANLEVRWVHAKPRANGTGTRLINALKTALRDVPPDRFAGAILVTDGQIHDDAALWAYKTTAPVHVLLTGRKGERDRRLVVEHAPKFGIVGEQLALSFRVDEDGASKQAPQTIEVSVKRNGKIERKIKTRAGQTIKLKLKIDHAGLNIIELIASPGPAELTKRNNRALIAVQGIRDRLRVLLVSGEPHQGERTWRNLLKADAAVDLVHFTILRPPEKQDGTPIRELSLIAFPTRQLFSEKLHEFDLIIFDRYQRRGVLPLVYLANVTEYVEKGGAVLAAAGPAFASAFSLYRTPLASILPGVPTGIIISKPYRATVTKLGRRHPVTANLAKPNGVQKKWGRWYQQIDAEPVDARELLSGADKKPLLLLRRQGKGRVALLLSDNAWLWARGHEGGGPYAELLRRLSHWLMKEPELEEERLIARVADSKIIIERRTMADRVDRVSVISPSSKTSKIELKQIKPGLFQSQIKTDETGLYRLESGTLSTVAAVGVTDLLEWSDVRSTSDKLKTLTTTNNGGIHRLWQTAAHPAKLPLVRFLRPSRRMSGDGWLGLQRNNIVRTLAIRNIPLFGMLAAIAAILALLGLVWFREGH